MTRPRPPRISEWIVRMLDPRDAVGAAGDLRDEFVREVERTGDVSEARRAYRRDVWGSVLPLLRMRARTIYTQALTGTAAGVLAELAWFVGVYAVLVALAEPGGRPLGDLSLVTFLVVWVGGGAMIGGLTAGCISGREGLPAALIAGALVAAFILIGLDEPASLLSGLAIVGVALGSAWLGGQLGSIGTRRALPPLST